VGTADKDKAAASGRTIRNIAEALRTEIEEPPTSTVDDLVRTAPALEIAVVLEALAAREDWVAPEELAARIVPAAEQAARIDLVVELDLEAEPVRVDPVVERAPEILAVPAIGPGVEQALEMLAARTDQAVARAHRLDRQVAAELRVDQAVVAQTALVLVTSLRAAAVALLAEVAEARRAPRAAAVEAAWVAAE
jgi:hypothetical protein